LTPSAWKTASTVTGSVAEMSEPNMSAARPPIGCEMPCAPAQTMIPAMANAEMTVPKKAKSTVGTMLSKKALRFMLYPASKMIGGSSQIMKNSKSKRMSDIISLPLTALKMAEAAMPRSTPTPASGR
jgi:hypothetical protein